MKQDVTIFYFFEKASTSSCNVLPGWADCVAKPNGDSFCTREAGQDQ